MLGVLALMAVTIAGADAGRCATEVEEAAVQRMIAAAEAEFYVQEVYSEAEIDFAARLDEVGLAGSTLAREQARAAAAAPKPAEPAVARNR